MKSQHFPSGIIGILAGLGLLGGAVLLLGKILLPEGGGPVTAVWWFSIVILLIGIGTAVYDLWWLRREWKILYAMERQPRPLEYAENLDEQNRNTLIARRARFIESLRDEESRAPQDLRTHFRDEALVESARIGSTTRFLGSALLLLAVLGTFAGMKTALPRLIAAINDSTTLPATATGAGGQFLTIAPALAPVADAFGANFLALIGALVMGVIAFGATSERRQFLSVLDRVSEQQLYRLVPVGATASVLERAVQEMARSIQSVGIVGDRIQDLQLDIGKLQGALVDAIGGLQSSFTSSLQRQSINIQSQLMETVGKVAKSMHDVSVALENTANSHQGLVRGLEERDLGIQKASAEMRDTGSKVSAQVARASDALVRSGDQVAAISSTVAGIAETISQQTQRSEQALEVAVGAIQDSTTRIADELAAHTATVQALPGVIDAAEQRHGEKLDALAQHHGELLIASQVRQNEKLDALHADQLARLETLIERQVALRGELVTINQSIQAGLRGAREGLEAHLQAEGKAIRGSLDQVRTTIDSSREQAAESSSEGREFLRVLLTDWQLSQSTQLNDLRAEQVAKLESLIKHQSGTREVLHNVAELIQRGLPDEWQAWESRLQAGSHAIQSELDELRATVEAIPAQTVQHHATDWESLHTRLQELKQALQQLQELDRTLITLVGEQAFPRDDVLQSLGQVGQGTVGIQQELVNLRDLVIARLDTHRIVDDLEPQSNGSYHAERRTSDPMRAHDEPAT
jgi:ribosomal protein S13